MKPEVRFGYLDDRMVHALRCAALWSYRTRIDVDINSFEDTAPNRVTDSFHPLGLAVDLDTVGDVPADNEALADSLRRTLPPGYDVILEKDHVHVEADSHAPPLRRTT